MDHLPDGKSLSEVMGPWTERAGYPVIEVAMSEVDAVITQVSYILCSAFELLLVEFHGTPWYGWEIRVHKLLNSTEALSQKSVVFFRETSNVQLSNFHDKLCTYRVVQMCPFHCELHVCRLF